MKRNDVYIGKHRGRKRHGRPRFDFVPGLAFFVCIVVTIGIRHVGRESQFELLSLQTQQELETVSKEISGSFSALVGAQERMARRWSTYDSVPITEWKAEVYGGIA